MGNQTCCCHVRQIDLKTEKVSEEKKKQDQPKPKPKPKTKKKQKKSKPLIQIKENIQNYFSPEVADFLSKLKPKVSEPGSSLLKEDTTDDYSSTTMKTSQSNTSFSDNSQNQDEEKKDLENDIYYIDLPDYTLDQITTLTEREQKEISWLLLQFNATDEEIDGFVPVRKKNRYGVKQHRWLLLTTSALYLVMPHNFLTCRLRIKLAEIVSVIQSSDNSVFAFEVMGTERFFLMFYSNRTLDIINAVQSLRYFITSEIKAVTIVKSEKDMANYTHIEETPFEQDLMFLKIKADYGYPGEELIKTIELSMVNEKKQKNKVFLLLTNKTIYFLLDGKKLFNFMDFEEIHNVSILTDSNEIVISSEFGDVWLSSLEIDLVLHDIKEVYQNGIKTEIETIYLDESEVKFNKMNKIDSNRKRKLPKDFVPITGFTQVKSRSNNIIDSLIRAL